MIWARDMYIGPGVVVEMFSIKYADSLFLYEGMMHA